MTRPFKQHRHRCLYDGTVSQNVYESCPFSNQSGPFCSNRNPAWRTTLVVAVMEDDAGLEAGDLARDILSTLSFAFDNLMDANFASFSSTAGTPLAHAHAHAAALEKSPGRTVSRVQRVRKFQRLGRRSLPQSKTPSPLSEPESLSTGQPRKRSWPQDDVTFSNPHHDGGHASPPDGGHTGKRSKSLVLLQEMESLRVSSPTDGLAQDCGLLSASQGHLDWELDSWAQQDALVATHHAARDTGRLCSFDHFVAELEGQASTEDVMKMLAVADLRSIALNRVQFTAWTKWRLVSRLLDTLQEPGAIKGRLNRSILLARTLTLQSPFLDWTDPELVFLLFKYTAGLLRTGTFVTVLEAAPSTKSSVVGLNRRMDEFIGLLRFLNLMARLHHRVVPSGVNDLLVRHADTVAQIAELLESLLEATLNLFELATILAQQQLPSASHPTSPKLSADPMHDKGDFYGIQLAVNFATVVTSILNLFLHPDVRKSEPVRQFIARITQHLS